MKYLDPIGPLKRVYALSIPHPLSSTVAMLNLRVVLPALAVASLAVEARPFYGGTPLALNLTTLQYDIVDEAPVAADFDFVHITLDSWGIPWDSFLYESPLPVSWEGKLNRTIAAVRAFNMPVLLSMPMGDVNSRSCPAQNASDTPGGYPNLQPVGNCKSCFDYNETTNPVASFFRQGQVNYALAILLAFAANQESPSSATVAVNFAIDSNVAFEANCGALWASAYASFSNQVHDSIRAAFPKLPAFPGFNLESLYGVNENQACRGIPINTPAPPPAVLACFDANYVQLNGIERDGFAFTTSPTAAAGNNAGPWYLSAAIDRLSIADRTNTYLVGTGMLTDDLVVNANNGSTPVVAAAAGKKEEQAAAAAAIPGSVPSPLSSALALPGGDVECVTLLISNTSFASSWFSNIVATATDYNIGLVVMSFAFDILPSSVMSTCPCAVVDPSEEAYCDYLSAYRNICTQLRLPSYRCEIAAKFTGTLGVRDITGAPKEPLYSTLQTARKVPALGNDILG